MTLLRSDMPYGATSAWRLPARPATPDKPLALVLITLLFIGYVVHTARIFVNFLPDAMRVAYALQALITLYYLAVAARRGDWGILGAGLTIIAFLLSWHMLFSVRAGAAFNANAIAMYFPLLAFVPFYEADCSIKRILQIGVAVAAVYLAFYIVAFPRLVNSTAEVSGVLAGHNSDEGRVYLAAAYAAFVAFYAVTEKSLAPVLRLGLLGLALIAFFLSGSRVIQLVFLMILALHLTIGFNALVRFSLFGLVMLVFGALLAGLVYSGWNPFYTVMYDDSAFYRAIEYSSAINAIKTHPLTGYGIPADADQLQDMFQTPRYWPLFGSDLGGIGPMIDFGLIGFIGFVASTYFALVTVMPRALDRLWPVKLTCMTLAMNGVLSPNLLFDASGIFILLLIASWLRYRRALAMVREKGIPGQTAFVPQHMTANVRPY